MSAANGGQSAILKLRDQFKELDELLKGCRLTEKHPARQLAFAMLHDVCGLADAAAPAPVSGMPDLASLQRYFNSEFGVEKFSRAQHKNMPSIETYFLAADVEALFPAPQAPDTPVEKQAPVKAGDRITDGIFTMLLDKNGATVYNALKTAGRPVWPLVSTPLPAAPAPTEQAVLPLPVATLAITRGLFDHLKEAKLNLLAELPAGTYDLFTSTQLKSHAARQANGGTK